jgi:hypothetical protein
MSSAHDADVESYNPWSVVNLVFTHLSDQGLHPILMRASAAATPSRGAGDQPAPEGNRM